MSLAGDRMEERHYLRDQEAHREIAGLRAGILGALGNEAFRSRTSAATQAVLEGVASRLEKDAEFLVLRWD